MIIKGSQKQISCPSLSCCLVITLFTRSFSKQREHYATLNDTVPSGWRPCPDMVARYRSTHLIFKCVFIAWIGRGKNQCFVHTFPVQFITCTVHVFVASLLTTLVSHVYVMLPSLNSPQNTCYTLGTSDNMKSTYMWARSSEISELRDLETSLNVFATT